MSDGPAHLDLPIVRRKLEIFGRVQMVGFRMHTNTEAKRLGIRGYVRNRDDGSVEAAFEGPAAAVDQMVSWCHNGPELARVSRVVARDEAPTGEPVFEIR